MMGEKAGCEREVALEGLGARLNARGERERELRRKQTRRGGSKPLEREYTTKLLSTHKSVEDEREWWWRVSEGGWRSGT